MRGGQIRIAGLIACAFLFFGCGSFSTNPVNEDPPAQNISELTSLEELIYTKSYAGYLVVFLKPSDDKSANVSQLEQIVSVHPAAQLKQTSEKSEQEVTAQRLYLENLSGKQLQDLNLIYHVEVSDPDEAVKLLRELKNSEAIDKVYPKRNGTVTSLITVPDLTGSQGYLYSNETHGGLNAQAVWDRGIRGEDVTVMDFEFGWNFDHEDLNFGSWYIPSCSRPGPYCGYGDIAHGTAVAGVIAAQDNGHGTTGFAPNVDLKAGESGAPSVRGIERLCDGIFDYAGFDELPPGSIFLIEMAIPGRLDPTGCDGTSSYGCMPVEIDPEDFASIEYATACGNLVISGATNGSVNLDDPASYFSYEVNLNDHDSGSIIVGASEGPNHQKIFFTNYGSPVDAYAWGQGVATTAYPWGDSSGPFYWTPGTGSNPPNDDPNAYYTNQFNGTSSATAMVAGAAALLQSYAKNVMGEPTTRYLMPLKMREILTTTGVAQSGGGGNIGKQPRLDRAIAAVDTFWSTVSTTYPELISGGPLTEAEMLTLRNDLGLGIICGHLDLETHTTVGPHDPACPDLDLWPIGTRIADTLDFDGDRRADLVSWTNGQWKVDLSSVGTGGDNYGEWDLVLNYTPTDSRWVWPYVEDFNSDGREDFAVYDKEHGKWYIAFTDSTLLGTGTWNGWDWEIDYGLEWHDTLEMNPWDSRYSRPAPGDYDNDGWMDIAIACSDGYWRIDYGGADRTDYGTFDQNFQYLSPARLAAAPGWAYLTAPGDYTGSGYTYIAYKIPDGLPEEGRMVIGVADDPTFDLLGDDSPHIFGGNHYIPMVYNKSDGYTMLGLKNSGTWGVAKWRGDGTVFVDSTTPPQGREIWGILECKPIIADFDGDTADDRAVMCPDQWRIEYTGSLFYKDSDGIRRVSLGYNTSKWTLPGRSYSGGVNYSYVQRVIEYYQEIHPTIPPPIPVDMMSVSGCSLPIEDPDGDCR